MQHAEWLTLRVKGGYFRWVHGETHRNFLTPARGSNLSTDHAYKMVFVQTTAINRSNQINDDLYLSFVDFQTVLSGSFDEIFLVGDYTNLLTF